MAKDVDAAWMAGFIDGEGCLAITRQVRKGRPSPSYRASVHVANTKIAPLKFFQEIYGGSIYNIHERRNGKTCLGWSDAYDWYCPVSATQRLLCDVLPYLMAKKDNALILLEFIKTKNGFSRGARKPGKHGGSAPLRDEEINHREGLYQESKRLNRKGKLIAS